MVTYGIKYNIITLEKYYVRITIHNSIYIELDLPLDIEIGSELNLYDEYFIKVIGKEPLILVLEAENVHQQIEEDLFLVMVDIK